MARPPQTAALATALRERRLIPATRRQPRRATGSIAHQELVSNENEGDMASRPRPEIVTGHARRTAFSS